MVNRIQNRNPGYSDNIFKNPNVEQNPINSIEGATALKLDQQMEIDTTPQSINNELSVQDTTENINTVEASNAQGISIENASYIENNLEVDEKLDSSLIEEEYTPKLFSDENSEKIDGEKVQTNKLFDNNSIDDEDFEIPAFLRKQKF